RWKSPGEWVRTGELIDKYRKAVKSLDNKNDVINKMIEKFSKKEELAYQRAIKDLEAKRRVAIEEGDTEAFDLADAEIKQHQQELDEFKSLSTEKKTDVNHDVAMEFVKRNVTWYNNYTFETAQMMHFAFEF